MSIDHYCIQLPECRLFCVRPSKMFAALGFEMMQDSARTTAQSWPLVDAYLVGLDEAQPTQPSSCQASRCTRHSPRQFAHPG